MLDSSAAYYFVLFFLAQTSSEAFEDGVLEMDPIFLTVSSLYRLQNYGSAFIDREIQLNWDESAGIEQIALYSTDPTIKHAVPALQLDTKNYTNGFLETNLTIGSPVFPGGWNKAATLTASPIPGDHCLPFWMVAYKDGNVTHAHCLKIRPTWMFDHRLELGNLPLTSLFLPGTHNSGCYKRGESLSKRDTVARFLLMQDQDVWSQLVYGIRYLDLRVGYYPMKNVNDTENENSYWINHDLIKVRLLVPTLQEIKQFVMIAVNEVVVLDLHRFPVGFSGRHFRHRGLVALLERELADIAIPFNGAFPNLDTIWEQDKRLIISYGDNQVASNHSWLWPPIRQLWGNQQSVEGLYTFLNSCMNSTRLRNPHSGMWAAMAQLTPTPFTVLLDLKTSLRTMAHSINRNITVWCRNQWWGQANIVTTDFFLENNVINIAVAANVHKGNRVKRYELS